MFSTDRARQSWRSTRIALLFFLLVSVAAGLPPVVWAQTSGGVPASYQAALDEARRQYDNGEFPLAILKLSEAIEELETRRQAGADAAGGLPLATWDELLVKALELRGLGYYAIGEVDLAQSDFQRLLSLDPGHKLDLQALSRKVVELFEAVRSELVGYVQIESRPTGARVLIDGRAAGVTPLQALPVTRGAHELRVEAEGYSTYSERVNVPADAVFQRSVELELNSGTVVVITDPPGVEVRIDGKLAGVTQSGILDRDVVGFIEANGGTPASSSIPLRITLVEPGQHIVTLSRTCYETREFQIEVAIAENRLPPIALAPSRALLSVETETPGARVYLGRDLLGRTPLVRQEVCAGRAELRVEWPGTAWRFVQMAQLAQGDHLQVEARPRPSLAYLGVEPSPSSRAGVVRNLDQRLRAALASLHRYNLIGFQGPSTGATLSNLQRAKAILSSLRSPPSGGGVEADPAPLRRAFDETGADLLLVGRIPQRDLERTVLLYLFSRRHGRPDVRELDFLDPGRLDAGLAALDAPLVLRVPWTGLRLADTLLFNDPVVLRVVPVSPAAKAHLEMGDVIQKVGTRAIGAARDFEALVRSSAPGTALAVRGVKRHGAALAARLVVGQTPVEVPLRGRADWLNGLLEGLYLLVEQDPEGTGLGPIASLNIGRIYLHFGDPRLAIEDGFSRVALPEGRGISMGTVQFRLGQAYERLGYLAEARRAYERAKQAEGATLGDNDGPPVADAAARRLAELRGR